MTDLVGHNSQQGSGPGIASFKVSDHLNLVDHHHVIMLGQRYLYEVELSIRRAIFLL